MARSAEHNGRLPLTGLADAHVIAAVVPSKPWPAAKSTAQCKGSWPKLDSRAGAHLLDRHGQEVSVHFGVQVQDLIHLLLSLRLGGKGCVALLPQELAGADEGRRVLELPAHHICPLIQAQGQVPVAPDPLHADDICKRSSSRQCMSGNCQQPCPHTACDMTSLPRSSLSTAGQPALPLPPKQVPIMHAVLACFVSTAVSAYILPCKGMCQQHQAAVSIYKALYHLSMRLEHEWVAHAHLGIVGVHDSLTGGADGNGTLQITGTSLRHPSYLQCNKRC